MSRLIGEHFPRQELLWRFLALERAPAGWFGLPWSAHGVSCRSSTDPLGRVGSPEARPLWIKFEGATDDDCVCGR